MSLGIISLMAVQVALFWLERKHLRRMKWKIMSKISDVADKVQANFDKLSGDLDEINKEIQAQNTRIQDLQNSPGTLDPVDEARLDVIASKSAELAAKADALVIPPVPAAPSP